MRALFLGLSIAVGVAFGQAAIAPPQLGWIASSGELRPVLGLAANFVLGDPVCLSGVGCAWAGELSRSDVRRLPLTAHEDLLPHGDTVISSAFSGTFALVKTDTSIAVLDPQAQVLFRADSDPGPALFSFSSDGEPAFVYLPESKSFLTWNIDHLEATAFALNGIVLAIGNLNAIVQREDGLWRLDLNTGTEQFIPGVDGPVLLRSDGSLLYSDSQSFILRQPDGTERRIDGSLTVAAFEQMDRNWVHITERDSTRHFAIRLEPGREQLFQLPDGAQ